MYRKDFHFRYPQTPRFPVKRFPEYIRLTARRQNSFAERNAVRVGVDVSAEDHDSFNESPK